MPGMAQHGEKLGRILAVYLAGLLIGGLYVGMVSPVRTVIQAGFDLDGTTGIWMINIYTLFYAALIPVIGAIADRRGRKRVLAFCVCLFCLGCTMCGISQWAGGFGLLLVGRVVQAAGAGGMIPVANAAIGTSFPSEKRGMALGLAAAVMGVSNVFGAAAGSGVDSVRYLRVVAAPGRDGTYRGAGHRGCRHGSGYGRADELHDLGERARR